MMLSNLQSVYKENKDKRSTYVRTLLKEVVQYYVLDFIYNSSWGKNLIFKGGTVLRFCFDLPRLSEDLDFDIENQKLFDILKFSKDLGIYLREKKKFDKFSLKISGNKRTLYIKMPILMDIGFPINKSDSNILHLRLDFAYLGKNDFGVKVTSKSARNLTFLVRSYELPELFAGKLAAILTREKMEGTKLVERFKGRDYFDLIWFLEKKVKPNWVHVKKLTGLTKTKALTLIPEKVKKVTKNEMVVDLLPFFEDESFVVNFADNFQKLVKSAVESL